MSISAHLVCPNRRLSLRLGKRLRDEDGKVFGFSVGSIDSWEDEQRSRALWKFLAETSGEELVVVFSDDEQFDTVAEYREIGGQIEDGDIPIEDYLRFPID
ncbi:hypothetical protein CLV72_110245 [Allonocardiopsis opalescens]|uniref:Uncharacterized protein n=1 Tax=Allonocardiopsis opalescens TaxID=1144618 RepID=A0A2T0PUB2_9ACTN|nr:hypothetical protein CLV72_110245 [Allonocardiopsis opalescens]